MPINFDDTLGVDFACVDDIDPSLSLVDGRTGLAHAAARRISAARGMLFYDPNYGVDVRGQISAPFSATQTARLVESEVIKDERVNSAAADVSFIEVPSGPDEDDGDVVIALELEDDDGPFDLTIKVTDLTVELLNEEVGA